MTYKTFSTHPTWLSFYLILEQYYKSYFVVGPFSVVLSTSVMVWIMFLLMAGWTDRCIDDRLQWRSGGDPNILLILKIWRLVG